MKIKTQSNNTVSEENHTINLCPKIIQSNTDILTILCLTLISLPSLQEFFTYLSPYFFLCSWLFISIFLVFVIESVDMICLFQRFLCNIFHFSVTSLYPIRYLFSTALNFIATQNTFQHPSLKVNTTCREN